MATLADTDHARDNASAWMTSINAMIYRWHHANECDGDEDDCDITAEDISSADCDRDEYHDADKAREAMEESALSVEVRSGWITPGEEMEAEEYMILLTTGGPALRIIGECNDGSAIRARLEYQDWGTPWTEFITVGSDHAALITFAQQFYFGA